MDASGRSLLQDDDEDDEDIPDRLSSEDAWLFPVVRNYVQMFHGRWPIALCSLVPWYYLAYT